MSLTDLMSGAGLSGYAVVALVIFFATFLALTAWIYWPTHRRSYSDAARIPLDDSPTTCPPEAP
jgi:cbb3-type cytochrome oxidase subunit 3